MSSSPLIAGVGLATPLGDTLESTWTALLAGSFITNHARVPGIESTDESRVDFLGRRVAREAAHQARWSQADLWGAALIVGTSKGPADGWLESFPEVSPPRGAFTFGLAQTATAIASDLRIAGPRLTLSSACSSGLHALIRGAMMIRHGEVKRAMIVAAESSLHPLFIASFKRLGVICPPGHGCRPFDTARAGFVVGEAAAAICLEASECASGSASQLAIADFSMAADATHLTANDPAGAMLSRMIQSTLGRQPVDLIHAHGTGTVANDSDELRAIEGSLDQPTKPVLYSHKGALGHSLGAAGLVAIAINCQCHREGIAPPNPNMHMPLPTTKVILSASSHRRAIHQSLTLAAGFGGALAAVRLSNEPFK